jgi:hypothetical protein
MAMFGRPSEIANSSARLFLFKPKSCQNFRKGPFLNCAKMHRDGNADCPNEKQTLQISFIWELKDDIRLGFDYQKVNGYTILTFQYTFQSSNGDVRLFFRLCPSDIAYSSACLTYSSGGS